MALQIGFTAQNVQKAPEEKEIAATPRAAAPRASLVRVRFEDGPSHTYYNDSFDLQVADFVYVEGARANQLGRITEVGYDFKIRRSEYQRVLFVVEREVHGKFYLTPSHFISFKEGSFSPERARLWLLGPQDEEQPLVGHSQQAVSVVEFPALAGEAVMERGESYYEQGRVHYLSLCGTRGYALVCGSEYYEVEFSFSVETGLLSDVLCTCPCVGICKHEVATVHSLLEILGHVHRHYGNEYKKSGSFVAVEKSRFLSLALENKESGSITF